MFVISSTQKCTTVVSQNKRTEGFTHNIFSIQMLLHTDVFTQTQIAHKKFCTQHAFTHSQLLRREALFPLLDHLPFVFPLSNFVLKVIILNIGWTVSELLISDIFVGQICIEFGNGTFALHPNHIFQF